MLRWEQVFDLGIKGYSNAEIAEILGITEAAVGKLVTEAMQRKTEATEKLKEHYLMLSLNRNEFVMRLIMKEAEKMDIADEVSVDALGRLAANLRETIRMGVELIGVGAPREQGSGMSINIFQPTMTTRSPLYDDALKAQKALGAGESIIDGTLVEVDEAYVSLNREKLEKIEDILNDSDTAG